MPSWTPYVSRDPCCGIRSEMSEFAAAQVGDALNFVIVPSYLLRHYVHIPEIAYLYTLSGIGRLILFTIGTYDAAPGVSIGLPTPAAAGLLFLAVHAPGLNLAPEHVTLVFIAISIFMHIPLRVWKPSLGKEKKAE